MLGVNQLGVKEQAAPLPHNTMYVRSFGTSDIRLAKTKFIDLLGEEAVNAVRASRDQWQLWRPVRWQWPD